MGRWLVGLAIGLVLLPQVGAAQDSYYSMRGLGHPSRPIGARSRGSAGAFAPFDPGSGVNPATAARIARLTASASTLVTNRTVQGEGIDASLRQTRFPVASLTGPFFFRTVYSVRVGPYLARSHEVSTQDTVLARDQLVAVRDRYRTDGGTSDISFLLAKRLRPNLDVAGSFHVLLGSARVNTVRTFEDTTYQEYVESAVESFDGLGVSVGVIFLPSQLLGLAGYARSDGNLKTTVNGVTTNTTDLPLTLGGGVAGLIANELRLAASIEWASWSKAQVTAQSFDTFSFAAGLELGPLARSARLGVRYATLPFGPTKQPTETAVAGGFGFGFAGGRGALDFAVERAWRSDDQLEEKLWVVSAGLTVRP
jgi:hypothetical protein